MGRKPTRKAKSTAPKRRRANAPKPLRELTPDYRARLKRAAKREGITVTELRKRGSGAARGHAAPPGKTESELRREKADAVLVKWAHEQASKWHGVDADKVATDILTKLRPQVKRQGMSWFRDLQRELAGYNREYEAQPFTGPKGRRQTLGIKLETLESKYELPRESFAYH